jgi:hypothetical protein
MNQYAVSVLAHPCYMHCSSHPRDVWTNWWNWTKFGMNIAMSNAPEFENLNPPLSLRLCKALWLQNGGGSRGPSAQSSPPPRHLCPDSSRSILMLMWDTDPLLELRELSRYSDWLRAGPPRGRNSSPGKSRIFTSPFRPYWFWGPLSLLCNAYWKLASI